MKKMTIEETKQVELEILKFVHEFCEKNGLKYFLAYGTLIGAVRHKGFIPWDDDIDIWMPRDDYNKLIEIFNKSVTLRYKLISPHDKVSRHSFVKIIDTTTVKLECNIDYKNGFLGVDIDIFPLDGQPDNEDDYVAWYHKLQSYYRLYGYFIKDFSNSAIKKLGASIINICTGGKKRILKKTAKLHGKYSLKNSKYIGAVECSFNLINSRYESEWFEDFILLDFENYKFKAPIGYDKILTQTYGDYMQFPPVEEQVTHHKNNTYWK